MVRVEQKGLQLSGKANKGMCQFGDRWHAPRNFVLGHIVQLPQELLYTTTTSHRRKGASGHLIDMVWLYRSPREF
jgi:hypothetical protein